MKALLFSLATLLLTLGCSEKESRLPIIGHKQVDFKTVDGKQVADTTFHTIADFSFINQDSAIVTQETLANKVYVSDFFFTSCPTICPIMSAQMLRVYETYQNNPNFAILSHSIDPEHDSVAVLKDYAERLGASSEKWHFVTGNKDSIFNIGQTSYLVRAQEDQFEPGGYIHSGAFILVDQERRIRGLYDGTKADEVDRLINDIPKLLKEYANE